MICKVIRLRNALYQSPEEELWKKFTILSECTYFSTIPERWNNLQDMHISLIDDQLVRYSHEE